MSDELNEIRMKKARELMQLLDKKEGSQEDEEKYEELKAMMPWSFRVNIENGFTEVLHNHHDDDDEPNVVCITVDPAFADMITEMLNRAWLFQQANPEQFSQGDEKDE